MCFHVCAWNKLPSHVPQTLCGFYQQYKFNIFVHSVFYYPFTLPSSVNSFLSSIKKETTISSLSFPWNGRKLNGAQNVDESLQAKGWVGGGGVESREEVKQTRALFYYESRGFNSCYVNLEPLLKSVKAKWKKQKITTRKNKEETKNITLFFANLYI